MVAISLYRGNLHRLPDVPRRWLMPHRSISLRDFRCLLHRRSRALSRTIPAPPTAAGTGIAESRPVPDSELPTDAANSGGPSVERQSENPTLAKFLGGTSEDVAGPEEANNAFGDPTVGGSSEEVIGDRVGALGKGSSSAVHCNGAAEVPAAVEPQNRNDEPTDKVDAPNDKEKRKKEVEEKLQVLNAKKHNLVLVLKQILNAEEELKRRNSLQGMATKPSLPLRVDVTNDSGSMIRHPTPRPLPGPDGSQAGDAEGIGEAEDTVNHHILARPLLRMRSASPSPESSRRPAFSQLNSVPHSSRSGLAATVSSSPSRFAPQGHPATFPGVSLSGTNYIASTPSPAASGGTSAFKDARQPSPWN